MSDLRTPMAVTASNRMATRRRTWRRRSPRRMSPMGVVALVILCLGALGMVIPFLWMFSTSMRPATEAYDLPPHWMPFPMSSENYVNAVTGPVPLLRNLWNSLVIAVAVTVAQVILCPLAGYAFARLRFPFRNAMLVVLLSSLMVPVQVTIIPLYLLMRNLGLLNNPLSLILPALTGAFGVFLMRQFFLGLPEEILEAARVDGAGPLTTYRRVAFPLALPGVSTLAVITFLTTWNAFFAPSIFLSSIETATMPLALVLMLGPYKTGDVAMIMAATTIAIIPALLMYLFGQRWIVESLTQSGVKG